jgi:hypothetical protein
MAQLITEWDDEAHTIMRVTYRPGWTWDDLEGNLSIEEKMLDSVDHRIDVIADFRGTRLPPGAISRLPKIAQSPPYTHRNSGSVVMVGSPAFMEEVVGLYKRLYGQAARLTMVKDLDEARALIANLRREREAAPPKPEAAPPAPAAAELKPEATPPTPEVAPPTSEAAPPMLEAAQPKPDTPTTG